MDDEEITAQSCNEELLGKSEPHAATASRLKRRLGLCLPSGCRKDGPDIELSFGHICLKGLPHPERSIEVEELPKASANLSFF